MRVCPPSSNSRAERARKPHEKIVKINARKIGAYSGSNGQFIKTSFNEFRAVTNFYFFFFLLRTVFTAAFLVDFFVVDAFLTVVLLTDALLIAVLASLIVIVAPRLVAGRSINFPDFALRPITRGFFLGLFF